MKYSRLHVHVHVFMYMYMYTGYNHPGLVRCTNVHQIDLNIECKSVTVICVMRRCGVNETGYAYIHAHERKKVYVHNVLNTIPQLTTKTVKVVVI